MFDWLSDIFGHHNYDHDSDNNGELDHQEHIGDPLHLATDSHVHELFGASEDVQALYALDRMTNDIHGFDLEEMKHFVTEKSFDPHEYQGLISNWKGVYGELKSVENLNAFSHDGLQYVIPSSTTNPDVDIYGLDEHGNVQEMIQVKMTDQQEYVREALDKLPEGVRLMCPSEVAHSLSDPRIMDAGFTHAELINDLNDTTELLNTPEEWEKEIGPEFQGWLENDFKYEG